MRVDQRDEISDMVDALSLMLRRLDEAGEMIAALRIAEAIEALQLSDSRDDGDKAGLAAATPGPAASRSGIGRSPEVR